MGAIKALHRKKDSRKQDFSPIQLNFGSLQLYLAKHFGFCYGVENAIEKSYQALDENPNKRVFLLSQMIHNPMVNADLQARGIQFIQDTSGKPFIPWREIKQEDVVIIPAFGAPVETEKILADIGVDIQRYNTTCPFVEKVWNRAQKIGEKKYTVIIHGKLNHEETRATFSHTAQHTPAVIVQHLDEAKKLSAYLFQKKSQEEFEQEFRGHFSKGFSIDEHLNFVGVVNQTTMLASDTMEIADFFKQCMVEKFGEEGKQHFADTRDTLCYATMDNQQAVIELLKQPADVALIVGGYNSSNTSHLVELCEKKLPTYFVESEKELISSTQIKHFDIHTHQVKTTENFLPSHTPARVLMSSGASCPDSLLDKIIERLLTFFPTARTMEELREEFAE